MAYDKYEREGPVHHQAYEAGEPSWYKLIIDFALERLEGKKILDVGCGDGLFLKLITDQGYEATGIEENGAGITFCKRYAPQAKIIAMNIHDYRTNPDPQIYDTLVCINTIEHLEHPEKVMEMFVDQITNKMIIITDVPRSLKKKGRHHWKEYQPQELIDLLGIGEYKHLVTEGLDRFWAVEVWK